MVDKWVFSVRILLLAASASQTDAIRFTGHRRVSLENNGYTGVSVAISPDLSVDPADREDFVQNIQNLLTSASASVYAATGNRAYFEEVRILIPASWDINEDAAAAVGEDFSSALLKITQEGAYATAPFTHHSGPCGTPGIAMSIPADFISNNPTQQLYGDPGKVIAQEWLRLRYGVFEEHGFPGDELYPQSFENPVTNSTDPTFCTDMDQMEHEWINEADEECDPSPADSSCRLSVNSVGTASHSIMSTTFLSSVIESCSDANHITTTPSRQNRLCSERSIMNVIQDHPDFGGSNTPGDDSLDTGPTFVVVKNDPLPLLLLLDDTIKIDLLSNNGGLGIYGMLKNTLQTIVEEAAVPLLGICKFGDSETFEYYNDSPLSPIESIDIDELLNFIPSEINADAYQTNVQGAVVDASEQLVGYSGMVNFLVIQISNQYSQSTDPDLTPFSNIVMNAVIYNSAINNRWIDEEVARSGGIYNVDIEGWPVAASSVTLTLVGDQATEFVAEGTSEVTDEETIQFVINGNVGDELFMNFATRSIPTSPIRDDGGRFDVEVFSPSGDMYNVTVLADTGELLLSNPESGSWSFTITQLDSEGSSGNLLVDYGISTRLSPGLSQVVTSVWTSADYLPSQSVDLTERPLAIFVSLLRGGSKPVVGMEVLGTLQGPSSSSDVVLTDNGVGDPDTQLGDGIYSAYIIDMPSSSDNFDMEIVISIKSSATAASTVLKRKIPKLLPIDPFSPLPCCGSEVPGGVTLGNYERKVTSLQSVNVINGNSYDPPPLRVSDFHMEGVDQNGPDDSTDLLLVTLVWTATGEDLNYQTASSYDLRYSEDRDQLKTDFANAIRIEEADLAEGSLVPTEAGTTQRVVVELPKLLEESTVYYFAIVAVDAAGQTSPLSPIEMTAVSEGREITTTTTTTITTSTAIETDSTGTETDSTGTGTATGSTETDSTGTVTGSTGTGTVTGSTGTGTVTGSTGTGTVTGSTGIGTVTGSTETDFTGTVTGSTETDSTGTVTGSTETDSTGTTSVSSTSPSATNGLSSTSSPGATQPGNNPTTEASDDFVGSTGFWIVVAVAIVVFILAILLIFRLVRLRRSKNTLKFALEKPDSDIPYGVVVGASIKKGVQIEGPQPTLKLPPIDPAKRRPSLAANVLPKIEEDRTSAASSNGSDKDLPPIVHSTSEQHDEVRTESETKP